MTVAGAGLAAGGAMAYKRGAPGDRSVCPGILASITRLAAVRLLGRQTSASEVHSERQRAPLGSSRLILVALCYVVSACHDRPRETSSLSNFGGWRTPSHDALPQEIPGHRHGGVSGRS